MITILKPIVGQSMSFPYNSQLRNGEVVKVDTNKKTGRPYFTMRMSDGQHRTFDHKKADDEWMRNT
jgi:hypothetical protein